MTITELWEAPMQKRSPFFRVGAAIGNEKKCVRISQATICGSSGYADAFIVYFEDGSNIQFPATAVAVRTIPRPEDTTPCGYCGKPSKGGECLRCESIMDNQT